MSVAISIDESKCRHDGLCQKVCPMAIFVVAKGGPVEVRWPEECVLCGQCMAVCPHGAISNSRLDPASFVEIAQRQPVAPAAFLSAVAQRRSVRVYKKERVPRDVLAPILEIAGQAPGSPHHAIGWERRFVVVDTPEGMEKVRELTVDYSRRLVKLLDGLLLKAVSRFSDEAAAARGIVPDMKRRLEDWERGVDTLTYRAPGAIFAVAPTTSSEPQVDCDAALMVLLLALDVHGIGACWNGILSRAVGGDHVSGCGALGELLGVPEGHKCYAAATFGYPAIRYARVPHRVTEISWR